METRSGMPWEKANSAGRSRGVKLLHDPLRNQGTSFSRKERDLLAYVQRKMEVPNDKRHA